MIRRVFRKHRFTKNTRVCTRTHTKFYTQGYTLKSTHREIQIYTVAHTMAHNGTHIRTMLPDQQQFTCCEKMAKECALPEQSRVEAT